MSKSVVQLTLAKFRTQGYDMERLSRPARERFRVIPDDVQQVLIEPAMLQLLAAFGIRDRVRIIRNLFGARATFSTNTLRRFYHSHGISYRAAKQVYEQSRLNLPGRERDRS